MDGLLSFFARTGLLPHAYCVSGNPALLWSGVGSDLLIAGAYFSIPLAIMHFVRRRGEREHNALAWLFSAFIFACGITHVMDVWTVWQPDYGAQVLAKGVTAALSIVTAVALWPLIPRALAIPSVTQLRSAIGALETDPDTRSGDSVYGGRIAHSVAGIYSIGASYLKEKNDSKDFRKEEGFDVWLRPLSKIELMGTSTYNAESKNWMQHQYHAALGPFAWLRLNADASKTWYK